MFRLFITILFSLVLSSLAAQAATPTLVQAVSCPNSNIANRGSALNGFGGAPPWDYNCPLAEPSQQGNLIVVGVIMDASGDNNTISVSDDKSNSYSVAVSALNNANSPSRSTYIFYAMNAAPGARRINVHLASGGSQGFFAVHLSEWYNVATSNAFDAGACNYQGSAAAVDSGNITPGATGELLYQDVWEQTATTDNGPLQTAAFAASNQSGLGAVMLVADLNDGSAAQYGVYNSTATINPTLTAGSGAPFSSCSAFFKSASAGTAPTQAFRIVHLLHQQQQINQGGPFPIQFPSTGNEIIVSANGVDISTGVSSNPANTWSNTGASVNYETISSQMFYACNARTATSLTMSIGLSITDPGGSTYLVYDFTGAPTSSCFDDDSGGLTGDQTAAVSALTICSSCLTPKTAGGVTLANYGQWIGTVTSLVAPAGGVLDSAYFTGNLVSGPQQVDQNNGWMHYYNTSTSPISVTWGLTTPYPTSFWGGRVAHFNGPAATGAITCDLNGDGTVNVVDVQLAVNMDLGLKTCTADVEGPGVCNVNLVNAVVTAALGGACTP